MLNKGYALIDALTTLNCMVMVASDQVLTSMRVESRNEINERAKKYMVRWELQDRENQVEDQHNDEHWRLNISYPASDRLRVKQESFGSLLQIRPQCSSSSIIWPDARGHLTFFAIH